MWGDQERKARVKRYFSAFGVPSDGEFFDRYVIYSIRSVNNGWEMPVVLLDVCLMSYWMLSGMSFLKFTFLFDDKAQMDCTADKILNTSQTFFAKLDVIMKDKGTVQWSCKACWKFLTNPVTIEAFRTSLFIIRKEIITIIPGKADVNLKSKFKLKQIIYIKLFLV